MLSSIVRTKGRSIRASQQLARRARPPATSATILPLEVALSTGRQSQLHRPPKLQLLAREAHPERSSPVLRCGLNAGKFALCNVKRTLLIFICSVW